ncbi:MAG: hypothetical protein LBU11_07385 [Zoogloeaceae bacterium]|jgi:hypothetical protein|nr:hypothetical protein [Zoogloeaceae bacterium]
MQIYTSTLPFSGGREIRALTRHYEARSNVAIQAAVPFSGTTKQVERLPGLPQAYDHRGKLNESRAQKEPEAMNRF